jgi:hypothetical protein
MKKHPIQPLEKDSNGVLRFKKNAIVEYLLDNGGINLHDIACLGFSREDHEQFAQLIGYSLSGFSSLSYASNEVYETADRMFYENKTEEEARIEVLEETLSDIKKGLREVASTAFNIHPDDLD